MFVILSPEAPTRYHTRLLRSGATCATPCPPRASPAKSTRESLSLFYRPLTPLRCSQNIWPTRKAAKEKRVVPYPQTLSFLSPLSRDFPASFIAKAFLSLSLWVSLKEKMRRELRGGRGCCLRKMLRGKDLILRIFSRIISKKICITSR